jgi:hypothetical protein
MKRFTILGFLCVSLISGCVGNIPKEALTLQPESLQNRQMQTRRFATTDENKLLGASTALLQDMGFSMEEANAPLGVLVASKMRDATDAAQVTLAVIAAIGGRPVPIDKEQKMRASVVTKILPNGKEVSVRVTFQRIVFNTQGAVTKAEAIIDPQIYQEFFSKLSKSVFLEANQI